MTNQNSWIAAMKEEWKKPEYAKMKLVATVYGDDQDDKSYREMQALVKAHPNLKGVISPTTIGIRSGAKAIMDGGLVGKVYITGLGLPSEMKDCGAEGRLRHLRDLEPGRLWLFVDDDHGRHPGRRQGGRRARPSRWAARARPRSATTARRRWASRSPSTSRTSRSSPRSSEHLIR